MRVILFLSKSNQFRTQLQSLVTQYNSLDCAFIDWDTFESDGPEQSTFGLNSIDDAEVFVFDSSLDPIVAFGAGVAWSQGKISISFGSSLPSEFFQSVSNAHAPSLESLTLILDDLNTWELDSSVSMISKLVKLSSSKWC